tara:strand:+ start:110 stop:565 length:456 start_codon:yes stop_codon:yes gene_type:complete
MNNDATSNEAIITQLYCDIFTEAEGHCRGVLSEGQTIVLEHNTKTNPLLAGTISMNLEDINHLTGEVFRRMVCREFFRTVSRAIESKEFGCEFLTEHCYISLKIRYDDKTRADIPSSMQGVLEFDVMVFLYLDPFVFEEMQLLSFPVLGKA